MSNTAEKVAPKGFGLDMDRTLVPLSRVINKLVQTCLRVGGIDTDTLELIRQETESAGGSFDVLDALKKMDTPTKKILKVQDRFAANEEGDDLLYADARALLSVLEETQTPHIVLTYGSPDWQEAKLEASGLDVRPYLITDKKEKGELIETWRNEQGLYRVIAVKGQLFIAQSVDLIDDKANAYRGLPMDCEGHHLVRHEEEQTTSQKGELPWNASVIFSLSDLIPAVYAAAASRSI